METISFNLSRAGYRQSRVLGCKPELPSYSAEVVSLKNYEEVHAFSIPVVISSGKQLNTVMQQAFKTSDVDVAHSRIYRENYIGGGGR